MGILNLSVEGKEGQRMLVRSGNGRYCLGEYERRYRWNPASFQISAL